VEAGAKKYAKESGDYPWHKMFDVPTRKAVAEDLTRHFETEAKIGNYDNLLPMKYQAEGTPAGKRLKKSGAQLNREIAEALGSRARGR
jgi:hypothetical protein